MSNIRPKPFLSYEKQVDNLTSSKQLIITDYDSAISKLHDICYFSLIDGYKNLFYNPMTRTYEAGTDFKDIVTLYEFDEKLRFLIFRYICQIEQKIRSCISYTFCNMHSVFQSDYLTPTNYNYTKKNRHGIDKLINILAYEANLNSEHSYVVHQRTTYGNVPLWVIMNTLTFGQTSKMYSFLGTSLQSKISINYPHITEKELSQYLKFLTHFRNICAHNERLYSFKSRFDIPDTLLHSKLCIAKFGNQYIYGKNDLFAVMICFRYLLKAQNFIIFKKELSRLINSFTKKTDILKKAKLLNAMGFPQNWENITRYKL